MRFVIYSWPELQFLALLCTLLLNKLPRHDSGLVAPAGLQARTGPALLLMPIIPRRGFCVLWTSKNVQTPFQKIKKPEPCAGFKQPAGPLQGPGIPRTSQWTWKGAF